MKTTSRKTSPKLPFHVPAPVEKVLKTAGHRFDALSLKAKNVAVQTEKKVKVAAHDLKKTGESLAKDPRAFVEDVMETGRDFGQMLRKNAGKVGGDVQERVQKAGAEAALFAFDQEGNCYVHETTRRSIRAYQDKAVPDDLVKQILTAAMYAPSAGNAQPWQFVVVNW